MHLTKLIQMRMFAVDKQKASDKLQNKNQQLKME